MSFSNPDENDEEQNTTNQQREDHQATAAPRAASERHLEEVEKKTEDAQRMAVENVESVRQELHQEIEAVREENQKLRAALHTIDSELELLFEKAKHRSLGKSFSRSGLAFERVEGADSIEEEIEEFLAELGSGESNGDR